ncbi:hypothetical protein YWY31_38840 [Paenibacillus illinoisensis]
MTDYINKQKNANKIKKHTGVKPLLIKNFNQLIQIPTNTHTFPHTVHVKSVVVLVKDNTGY